MRAASVSAVLLVLALLTCTWTSIQGVPVNIETAEEEHVIQKRGLGDEGGDTTVCFECAWNNPGM